LKNRPVLVYFLRLLRKASHFKKGNSMLSKIASAAIHGIDPYLLEIEVDVGRGLPGVIVVGLPDAAVKESRDRVKSAIINSGFRFPVKKITVNLAPADVRKEGPAYDLPIALALLLSTKEIESNFVNNYAVVGELALNGTVRAVKGCLSMAMAVKEQGLKGFIVPAPNAAEAAMVEGIDVIPVGTLADAAGFISGNIEISPHRVSLEALFEEKASYAEDFSDVRGQESAKRALVIAAAGAHNVVMIGPPGAGKTMLARRLPTILPPLTREEALSTTRIYSACGLLSSEEALIARRPFRSPHHTISDAGLIGGGTLPRPGEVSLAHNGVLFLDELPEFHRSTLEALRQPLEDGTVTISRAQTAATFPANFMLVGALNPCPCGYFTDPTRQCKCSPREIQNYLSKISGPLLDRIDIHIEIPALKVREIRSRREGTSSEAMREQVLRGREVQMKRFGGKPPLFNGRMATRDIGQYCSLDSESEILLSQAMQEMGLSARAHNKILKVARTIADLEGSESIQQMHLMEAINYRSLDRQYWG